MKKVLLVLSKDVLPGDVLARDSALNCAGVVDYLEDHPDYDKIMISGGVFRSFQSIPVSILMLRSMSGKLKDLGYSGDSILIEDESKDTYQNLWNSIQMLQKKNIEPEFTIIAHWVHALRAKYILSRRGIKSDVFGLRYSLGLRGWCYEILAWIMTVADSQGTGFLARRNRAARTFKES